MRFNTPDFRKAEEKLSTHQFAKGKHLDDVPRIKEVEAKFNYKTKFDSEEFARQLKDQEKGMNELTVYEYQKNREHFIDKGRAMEGNAAQKIARKEAYTQKAEELQGPLSQAKKKLRNG